MRLTVGSLPSAVYWRRRAIVVSVVFFLVATGWIVFLRMDDPTARRATVSVVESSQPSPDTFPLGSITSAGPSASAESIEIPIAAEAQAPVSDGTVACADSEILLTPIAEPATGPRGHEMRLTIKIRNTSSRTCPRDLGADEQELYLQQGDTEIYSSDTCDPKHGTLIRSVPPGVDYTFYVTWDGGMTSHGCTSRQPPPPGKYRLFARLGTKISEPVAITLTD